MHTEAAVHSGRSQTYSQPLVGAVTVLGLFASMMFLALALGIARWATRRPVRDNESRWREASGPKSKETSTSSEADRSR